MIFAGSPNQKANPTVQYNKVLMIAIDRSGPQLCELGFNLPLIFKCDHMISARN